MTVIIRVVDDVGMRIAYRLVTAAVALAVVPTASVAAGTVATASVAAGTVVAAPVAGLAAAPASPPPGRIVIGDSVAGMNTSALERRGFRVRATVSRQFWQGLGVMRQLGTRLPANVVIALGTNGYIELGTCRSFVRLAGPERTVFFVTNRVPRQWERPNNRTLRECVSSYTPQRARIIDWFSLSDAHSSWFYDDGYHPRESTGAVKYANLIDGAVDLYGR